MLLLVHTPADQIQFVDAGVSDVGGRGVPEEVPAVMEAIFIEGAVGRRSKKEVPVHALRNLTIRYPADARAPFEDDSLTPINLAKFSLPQVLHRRPGSLVAAALSADLDHTAVFPGSLNHLASFSQCIGNRLLDVHIFARLTGPDCLKGVPVIGCSDGNGINVRIFEKSAKIELSAGAISSFFLDLPTCAIE